MQSLESPGRVLTYRKMIGTDKGHITGLQELKKWPESDIRGRLRGGASSERTVGEDGMVSSCSRTRAYCRSKGRQEMEIME